MYNVAYCFLLAKDIEAYIIVIVCLRDYLYKLDLLSPYIVLIDNKDALRSTFYIIFLLIK
jgi:hypothetical protein